MAIEHAKTLDFAQQNDIFIVTARSSNQAGGTDPIQKMIQKLLTIIKSYWLILTALVFCSITFLSLWPLKTLPDVPGSDKIHHLIAYAALMFPVALARPRKWLIIGLLFVAWSGGIELVQPYVNRYGEWQDFAANCSGLLIGYLLSSLLLFKRT